MERRGPIRRKAGERKREADGEKSVQESAAPEVPETKEPYVSPPIELPKAPKLSRGGGRRIFDPRSERSEEIKPSATAGSAPSGEARRPRRGAPDGTPTANPDDEAKKLDERRQAQSLAKDKGIPIVHALRVVRGEASLTDVLRGLMQKAKIERLVDHEGIERGLAGQVAAGQLPKERALLITRIRKHRPHRLDRDALKVAELGDAEVSLWLFDGGWSQGRVTAARTYDVDFLPTGTTTSVVILKHDVKAVAPPGCVAGVDGAVQVDEAIREEGLVGTADRHERLRASDEKLLGLVEAETQLDVVLRDGTSLRGRLVGFGRWDMDVEIPSGDRLTVFFHALHRSCAFLET